MSDGAVVSDVAVQLVPSTALHSLGATAVLREAVTPQVLVQPVNDG